MIPWRVAESAVRGFGSSRARTSRYVLPAKGCSAARVEAITSAPATVVAMTKTIAARGDATQESDENARHNIADAVHSGEYAKANSAHAGARFYATDPCPPLTAAS